MEKPVDPNLTIIERPNLRRPILVAAFAGWPDAGEVATGALRYLAAKLQARKIAAIEADEFYDFSTLRPLIVVEQGSIQSLRFPSNDFLYWANDRRGAGGDKREIDANSEAYSDSGDSGPGDGDKADADDAANADDINANDLLLFLGTEPQLRWRRYVDILHQVIELYGVARVISFGSLFDAVPHTRAIKVSASTTDAGLRDRLRGAGVALSDYQGPTSIHSVFSAACQTRNVEATSLWAHCPQYVRATANPNACHALLSLFAGLIGLNLNLTDLKSAGERLDATLGRLLQENKEMAQLVRRLEEIYEDASATSPGTGPEPSTEASAGGGAESSAESSAGSSAGSSERPPRSAEQIIKEVEEFLRKEQKGENGEP